LNNQPKISVVLPVCNGAGTIARAIESILKQTFSDFELIIINNGSTDDTLNVIEGFSDSRIKYHWIWQKNLVDALNFGLGQSKAKIIARMDADDYSYPNRLSHQYTFLQKNTTIDLVSGLVEYQGDASKNKGYAHYVSWVNQIISPSQVFTNRFRESVLPHPTVMFRKSLVGKYGGYRNGAFPEDFELWLRWMAAGVTMGKVAELILQWNDLPGRLSRIDSRYHRDNFAVIKAKYFMDWYRSQFPKWKELDLLIWGNGKVVRRKTLHLQDLGLKIKYYIDVHKNKSPSVIHFSELKSLKNYFILSYVSDRIGKQQIEDFLLSLNLRPGRHFYMME